MTIYTDETRTILPFIIPNTGPDAPVQEALSKVFDAAADPSKAELAAAVLELRLARERRFPDPDVDPI